MTFHFVLFFLLKMKYCSFLWPLSNSMSDLLEMYKCSIHMRADTHKYIHGWLVYLV